MRRAAAKRVLKLPDLDSEQFLGGFGGRALFQIGLVVSLLGLIFGMVIYFRLKNMPVHKSMLEVSELIYATCKAYLMTQAKFLGGARALHRRDYHFLLWLSCRRWPSTRLSSSFCSA